MNKETEALLESLSMTKNEFKNQLVYIILKDNPLENFKKTKEKIFELIDFEKSSIATEFKRIKDKYTPDILEAVFEDSDYENEDFEKLTVIFCITYLASFYENTLKIILKIFLGKTKYENFIKQNKSRIYINNVIDEFKKHNIAIETISSFQIIREVCRINNCFKHNDGKVNDELQKLNPKKWQTNQQILISQKEVDCFTEELEEFFSDLYSIIEKCLIGQQ